MAMLSFVYIPPLSTFTVIERPRPDIDYNENEIEFALTDFANDDDFSRKIEKKKSTFGMEEWIASIILIVCRQKLKN